MRNKKSLLDTATYEELRWGYREDPATGSFTCICCGKTFESGEVYPFGNRYFDAARAIRLHLEAEHPDRFERLLREEILYNPLNENQKNCLSLFQQGFSVAEIAQKLSLSLQTVRQYKFNFRKRAKQARLYLALYEMAIGGKPSRRGRKPSSAPSARKAGEDPVTD